MQLQTPNLTLKASTLQHICTELEQPQLLGELLNAYVSASCPSGEYDRDAMEFFRQCFEQGGTAVEGWYGWYAIRHADASTPASLVGAAGYFGPPDSAGNVEIGYSVLPEWQGCGYASEMAEALVHHAFSFPAVVAVLAHTTEQNPASIRVLQRCGFTALGPGEEAGTLRFQRLRDKS